MSRKRSERELKCCICGKTIIGYGNDPWPVKIDGECCDKCNMAHVVPARIMAIKMDVRD